MLHDRLIAFSSTLALWCAVILSRFVFIRRPRWLVLAGGTLLLGGAGGWALLIGGPRDLWVRHPALGVWLHPYVLALDSILAVAAGVGLILAGMSSWREAAPVGSRRA